MSHLGFGCEYLLHKRGVRMSRPFLGLALRRGCTRWLQNAGPTREAASDVEHKEPPSVFLKIVVRLGWFRDPKGITKSIILSNTMSFGGKTGECYV